jgi:hypothetical protein
MTDPLDTMLDSLRTDVPEMSDQAFAAGRARVQAVAEPIPAATTLEPEPVVVTLPRRRPLRSPPRRLVRLVASAAAVVGLAAGVMAIQSGGEQAPVASAAVALNEAADNITATDPPVGPGQYLYTATHSWYRQGATEDGRFTSIMLVGYLQETWVPKDETHEWLHRTGPTGHNDWVLGGPADPGYVDVMPPEASVQEFRAPCGDYSAADENREPCSRDDLGWETLTREFLDGLPRDPAALLERLRTEGIGPSPIDVVRTAAGALGTGRVPADLRAALYRSLALMPELEITEELANLNGRVGKALGVTDDVERQDLIIDTATGQFIGERMVATQDGRNGPPGTVISYTAVTTSVADEIGVRPAG